MRLRLALVTRYGCLLMVVLAGCDDGSTPDAGMMDGGPPLQDAGPSSSCVGNGECNDGVFCNGEEQCVMGTCQTGTPPSCDDGIECTTDTCNEPDRRCDHVAPDADGDGVRDQACLGPGGFPLGRDCDDRDPDRFPDNPERCDAEGHDEDCDFTTFGGVDSDMDNQLPNTCCNRDARGVLQCGADCDDTNPNTFENAPELCDGINNDCDMQIDEDLRTLSFGRDCDRDTFGAAPAMPIESCSLPTDPVGCAGGIWVANTLDCDDTEAARNPGNVEVCDGLDNNCDVLGLVDEGLTFLNYYPDCDGDMAGDASVMPTRACMVPAAPMCMGGQWVTNDRDCDDGDATRYRGNTETCNGRDDDCNTLVDDVFTGTEICQQGQSQACLTACGTAGTQSCNATCTGFDTCVAPEQCNGCDDDADIAVDETFTCALGSSQSCTTQCGTPGGTQICQAGCGYSQCIVTTEPCNFCDDNGNGNFFDERPSAVVDFVDRLDCPSGTPLFGAATCRTVPIGMRGGFELYADILDGTANNQAGAYWFTPSDWFQGWGTFEFDVTLEAQAVSTGGMGAETALGGWAVVIDRGTAPLGVGTPRERGIPSTVNGIAASWYWSTFDFCYSPDVPPSASDSVRLQRFGGPGARDRLPGTGPDDAGCFSGNTVNTSYLNGPGPAVTQRMHVVYTPDDPTTASVSEERATISAGGSTQTYLAARPSGGLRDDQPVGSGPLRIGITAGTFTQSGFTGPPAALVFGVPVRASVHLYNFEPPTAPGPGTFTNFATVSRNDVCP